MACAMKQQLVGVPVAASHLLFSTFDSIAGIIEPWNNFKPSSGSSGQLTIFYDGDVNVFDDISPEKAQAIMLLAGAALPSNLALAYPKGQAQGSNLKLAAGDGGPASQSPNAPLPCSAGGAQSVSGSTSTDEQVAAKTSGAPSTPVSRPGTPKITMMPSGSAVPQARKASLARFLEKRRERVMSAAPYNLNKTSAEGSTPPEANNANSFSVPEAGDTPN